MKGSTENCMSNLLGKALPDNAVGHEKFDLQREDCNQLSANSTEVEGTESTGDKNAIGTTREGTHERPPSTGEPEGRRTGELNGTKVKTSDPANTVIQLGNAARTFLHEGHTVLATLWMDVETFQNSSPLE